MKAEIRHASAAREFVTEERCHIIEVANDAGDEFVSIARARVDVGVTTAWHRLQAISERYIIIDGQGMVEIEDLEPTQVGPGDVVRIPPGKAQRIANTGDQLLIFYAVCSPPFSAGAYINLEQSS